MPRKPASENVVCLCRLLNIHANFSNLFLHTANSVDPGQTAPRGQSELGPHCLQNDTSNHKQMTKHTAIIVIGSLRVNIARIVNFITVP